MAGLMAVVLGWLFLVQGLPDVDVLWSANVATNGPEFLARSAVTVLVAFGVGLVGGGIAAVRRFREPDASHRGSATRSSCARRLSESAGHGRVTESHGCQ